MMHRWPNRNFKLPFSMKLIEVIRSDSHNILVMNALGESSNVSYVRLQYRHWLLDVRLVLDFVLKICYNPKISLSCPWTSELPTLTAKSKRTAHHNQRFNSETCWPLRINHSGFLRITLFGLSQTRPTPRPNSLSGESSSGKIRNGLIIAVSCYRNVKTAEVRYRPLFRTWLHSFRKKRTLLHSSSYTTSH